MISMPLHGHQLTYNATKSFILCFKPKHIKIGLPDSVLGKLVIPAVDKCKYLGIIIVKHFHFK